MRFKYIWLWQQLYSEENLINNVTVLFFFYNLENYLDVSVARKQGDDNSVGYDGGSVPIAYAQTYIGYSGLY